MRNEKLKLGWVFCCYYFGWWFFCWCWPCWSSWWFQFIFFSPLLGEDEPMLTNIFQLDWFNHQPVDVVFQIRLRYVTIKRMAANFKDPNPSFQDQAPARLMTCETPHGGWVEVEIDLSKPAAPKKTGDVKKVSNAKVVTEMFDSKVFFSQMFS